MNICDERKPKTNSFEEVVVGQVFYVEDTDEYSNHPYMRCFEIQDIDDDYFNAIDLRIGELVWINGHEPVIFCNATLQIY